METKQSLRLPMTLSTAASNSQSKARARACAAKCARDASRAPLAKPPASLAARPPHTAAHSTRRTPPPLPLQNHYTISNVKIHTPIDRSTLEKAEESSPVDPIRSRMRHFDDGSVSQVDAETIRIAGRRSPLLCLVAQTRQTCTLTIEVCQLPQVHLPSQDVISITPS